MGPARGVDTTFLVELEIRESANHERAMKYLQKRVLNTEATLALCPQVLAEFAHVVTDPKRFERPLAMEQAMRKADFWWKATQVRQVFPDAQAVSLFVRWMAEYRLGRKRILDTMLAATYKRAGVTEVVTTNVRDFSIYEGLTPIFF